MDSFRRYSQLCSYFIACPSPALNRTLKVFSQALSPRELEGHIYFLASPRQESNSQTAGLRPVSIPDLGGLFSCVAQMGFEPTFSSLKG